MTRAKSVVLTFSHAREAADPIICTVCMKQVPAAGEDLVRIGLVANIPDQFVIWGVKYIVNGHGQLYSPQAAAYMPRVFGSFLDDEIPYLAT